MRRDDAYSNSRVGDEIAQRVADSKHGKPKNSVGKAKDVPNRLAKRTSVSTRVVACLLDTSNTHLQDTNNLIDNHQDPHSSHNETTEA